VAKSRPGKGKEASFPSREAILAFIADHPGRAGKREIARAFGIKGNDRIRLKTLLKELAAEGTVVRARKRLLAPPGILPTVSALSVVGRDADGDLLAEPAEWDEEQGPPPKVVLVAARQRGRPAGPAPAVGDRVLARIAPAAPGDSVPFTGRIVKIIERRPETVLGVVRVTAAGARLEPVSRKQREVMLEGDALKGVREGDLVSVTVTRSGVRGLPRARITEVIGSMKNEKAVSLIAIHDHGIPHVFPEPVLAEAAAAGPATLEHREDWRDLPLVTIDPPDARDHDDAVHAAPDEDPKNRGSFVVTVAIADVSWYVRPGSALDREARRRGNSVYFPDRVVPMLPERISNDLCSLREAEDRPALAVRMIFDAGGRKKSHSFHRIMMRSAASLSYRRAQDVFDGKKAGIAKLDRALAHLWSAFHCLRQGREEREPLELDIPERKVILKPDGSIDRVVVPERLEAHRLIEEFMIQANVAAAETLEQKKSPLVYRIHDTPSLAKLEALRQFLASIDLTLPRSGNLRPSHFNRILARAGETEHGRLLHEVVLRTQSQAEYSPANIGHFGLNLRRYAHFTSPIRRYADLIVHRALVRALKLGPGGLPDGIETELEVIAAEISAAERRAMLAERETIDRLVAHWLADRIGARFTGRISGVTRAGIFVKLDETGADGFVPMSAIGADYFRFDEARHAVVGARTGEMHRLGDPVEVKLVEVAPVAGALRFELLSEGRILPRAERQRTRRPAGARRVKRSPGKRQKG
jgi:ribonuclease R